MDAKRTARLLKKYPLIYRGYWGSIRASCMPFGFECQKGWYKIIDRLSNKIYAELAKHYPWYVLKYGHIIHYFIQRWNNFIHKFKWPKENLYFPDSKVPYKMPFFYRLKIKDPYWFSVTQVKEKYGTLRYYTNFCNDNIDKFIEEAERASSKTCETCGKPGKTVAPNRWYFTACKKCLKDYNERRRKMFEEAQKELGSKDSKKKVKK